MKIGRERARSGDILGWLGVLALVFVLGVILGASDWEAVRGNVRAFWSRLAQTRGGAGDLAFLQVDMDFASYERILAQRAQALEEGVLIPSDGDFVAATIRVDGAAVPVEMRLLEGPADHLGEGEKWPFEVHTRQDQRLLGMERFSLQDPADNNWFGQWAFALALEREGILAARYQFVRLVLNGDPRGIYALQEGCGCELPAAQGRQQGVTVRFDASQLWRSIIHFAGDAGAASADPVTNLPAADIPGLLGRVPRFGGDLEFFEVDAHRDAELDRDPVLSAQRDRALAMLRALQAGQLPASEAFDVEQYGRFLALTDLWGATEGMSLVNMRYYYDPASSRLEPVGYNANALGSAARVSLGATYGDPAIQAAYAREALRVSQPAYLAGLRTELEPELLRLQQAIQLEQKRVESLWAELSERQDQLGRSLDPVQPVFAYLGPPDTASGVVHVYVGNVLNLPVEIVELDIEGATVLPARRTWLADESAGLLASGVSGLVLTAFSPEQGPVVRYARLDVP
jgi:hypothetical protein